MRYNEMRIPVSSLVQRTLYSWFHSILMWFDLSYFWLSFIPTSILLLLFLPLLVTLGGDYPHQHVYADPSILLVHWFLYLLAGIECAYDKEESPSGTNDKEKKHDYTTECWIEPHLVEPVYNLYLELNLCLWILVNDDFEDCIL